MPDLNAPERILLPDTQSLPDCAASPIQKVGIKGLRYPVALRTATGSVQHTVAEFTMSVGLPHDVKGTHMSRFVEVLEGFDGAARLSAACTRCRRAMLTRLSADIGRHRHRVSRTSSASTAPVSGVASLLDYQARLTAETKADGRTRITVTMTAPVTSLCPCSKKISDYGAHNQRSHITITADVEVGELSFEELARVAEDEASCAVYGPAQAAGREVGHRARLRQPEVRRGPRPRHRAAHAARPAGRPIHGRPARTFESIHNHSAYAEIEGFGAARCD